MPWGAKGSFAGWVRGWACQHDQHCRPTPGCVVSVRAVLLSPSRPSLHSSSPSFCTIFSHQNARHPSDPELRAGTQERFIPGAGGCRSLQLSLFSSSSSSSLPAGLQPATSLSFTSMQASVQILRALFRPQSSAVGWRCVRGEVAALGSGKPESQTKVCSLDRKG